MDIFAIIVLVILLAGLWIFRRSTKVVATVAEENILTVAAESMAEQTKRRAKIDLDADTAAKAQEKMAMIEAMYKH